MTVFVACDDMRPLVCEAPNAEYFGTSEAMYDTTDLVGGKNEVPKEFDKLMEDTEAELYPSYNTFTRLEFIMTLLHIKVSCKWSDKSFSMLLSIQRELNNDENFPEKSS